MARVAGKALLSVMAERRTRRFKIGQDDDRVDEWMGRCSWEIYHIIRLPERDDQGEIEIAWSKILAGIPEVPSHDVRIGSAEGKNDILQFLEPLPGISISHTRWGGEMLGRGGIWIEVFTESRQGAKVLKALELIVSRLESTYPN